MRLFKVEYSVPVKVRSSGKQLFRVGRRDGDCSIRTGFRHRIGHSHWCLGWGSGYALGLQCVRPLLVSTREFGYRGIAIAKGPARQIQQKVRQLTDRPILYLVNTNSHGDHTFGHSGTELRVSRLGRNRRTP